MYFKGKQCSNAVDFPAVCPASEVFELSIGDAIDQKKQTIKKKKKKS